MKSGQKPFFARARLPAAQSEVDAGGLFEIGPLGSLLIKGRSEVIVLDLEAVIVESEPSLDGRSFAQTVASARRKAELSTAAVRLTPEESCPIRR